MRPSSAVGIARPLVGLAWPIVIARSTQVLVGVTDVRMVGHLGQDALAATADGALLAVALLVLPVGVVSIVSAFTAQLAGAGRPGEARRFGYYGLMVALATQVAALALLPSIPWALARLDCSPEVAALMGGVLRVRLFAAGAAVGLEALGSYYAGRGNTRLPMLAALSALLLNVAGNWLLIDGRAGLPALGVAGSALASTLATTLAFLGLLSVFLLDRGGAGAARTTLSARELRRMLRVGLPVGMSSFLEGFAFAFFVNAVMARFGTTTLAAFLTVLQLSALVTLPAFALRQRGRGPRGERHRGAGRRRGAARGQDHPRRGRRVAGARGPRLPRPLRARADPARGRRAERAGPRRAGSGAAPALDGVDALRGPDGHLRGGAGRGRRHGDHALGAGGAPRRWCSPRAPSCSSTGWGRASPQ